MKKLGLMILAFLVSGVFLTAVYAAETKDEKKALDAAARQSQLLQDKTTLSKTAQMAEKLKGKNTALLSQAAKSPAKPVPNGYLIASLIKNSKMVSSPDGGVVVLIGNKLVKYDKDLNIVKETKINISGDDINMVSE